VRAIATAIALGLVATPVFAQQDVGALKAEVDRLKADVEGLKTEMRLIRELILRRLGQPGQPGAPPRVVAQVSVAGNPTLGKPDAAVTLVEFPIDSIHPQARKAAEAAHCAGEQGNYWEMHDKLFQNQQALQVGHLKTYAEQLKLDLTAFAECVDTGKYASKVQKNYEAGATAGIRGTPGFLVGRTRADDSVEGPLISGARPLNDFRQEIERLLGGK
jgi:hypothetical protein